MRGVAAGCLLIRAGVGMLAACLTLGWCPGAYRVYRKAHVECRVHSACLPCTVLGVQVQQTQVPESSGARVVNELKLHSKGKHRGGF